MILFTSIAVNAENIKTPAYESIYSVIPLFINILATETIINAIKVLVKNRSLNENALITISSIGALLLNNVLEGMMVASGNDAAVVVAENVSGSVENFAKDMNRVAAKAGAKNSVFLKGWLRRLNGIRYGSLVTNKGEILK